MDGRIIIGVVLLGMSAVSRRLFGSWFSPSAFISALWGFLYLGQALIAPDYLFFGPGAEWIVVMNGFFSLGALLAWLMTTRQHPWRETAWRETTKSDALVEESFRRWFTVVAAIGFLGGLASITYSYSLSSAGNFTDLLTVGATVRQSLQETASPALIRYSNYFNYIGTVLGGIYLGKFGFRWRMLLPLVLLLLDGLFAQAKAGILIGSIMYTWGIYVGLMVKQDTKRDLYMARIGGALVIGASLLVVVVAALRNGRLDWQFVSDSTNQFSIINNYAFGALSGFDFYFTFFSRSGLLWGRQTFAGLADLLGLYSRDAGIYSEQIFVDMYSTTWTNVFSIFRPLLEDFGVVGSSAVMVFLGWGMTVIYQHVLRSRQVSGQASLLVCAYALLTWSPVTSLAAYNSFLAASLLSTFVLALTVRKVALIRTGKEQPLHLERERA